MTCCVLLLSASAAWAQEAGELAARQIIDKALDQNGLGFYSGVASLRLTVDDGAGKVTAKELVIRSTSEGEVTRAQVTLTAPAELAGEAYLFLGNDDREDDVYVYLPAFKKTRKVSGQEKKGKFLGTHLTYRDLETRDLESGTATRMDDEKVGPYDCYVIESRPGEGEDSEYSKVVTWVRKSDYMPLRVIFHGAGGAVSKRLFSEKIATSGDTKYVKRMGLFLESGGSTSVEVLEVDFDAEIPARVFTRESLGK